VDWLFSKIVLITGMPGVRFSLNCCSRTGCDFILGVADVEIHHLETSTPLSFSQVRVIAEGPLRAAVQTQVKYGQSTIDVTVRI
jgi:hypothetical protein